MCVCVCVCVCVCMCMYVCVNECSGCVHRYVQFKPIVCIALANYYIFYDITISLCFLLLLIECSN